MCIRDSFVDRAFLTQLLHQDPTATVSDMHWTPFSVPFQATAPLTTLTISDATGSPFPGGLALDDLSVTPAAGPNPPLVSAGGSGREAGGRGAHQVSLAWTDNSPSETAVAVWRQGGGADWARVGALAAHTTSFTDTGLAPGTSYTYRVRVISGGVAGDWSLEVSVTTLP